jgi:ATP synthase delta (OSCP) subunit
VHGEADKERARLFALATAEISRLHSEAEASIERDRAAMEKALIERARELAIEIARRLLRHASPGTDFDVFLNGLVERVRELPPHMQAAFTKTSGSDDAVEVVTATKPSADQVERIRRALEQAFGAPLTLAFRCDPDVLAGVELHCRHSSIRCSWREDLDRVGKELNFDAADPG